MGIENHDRAITDELTRERDEALRVCKNALDVIKNMSEGNSALLARTEHERDEALARVRVLEQLQVLNVVTARDAERQRCANIALALNSGRGNEDIIATSILRDHKIGSPDWKEQL